MTALFFILALLSLQIPAAVGLLGLTAALDIFLTGSAIQLSTAQSLSVAMLLFSLPLAAVLAGMFFDAFVGEDRNSGAFSLLLPVLACSLMFGSGWWMEFAEAALSAGRDISTADLLLLFSSAISAAVFCAGVVAFVAMALQLTFELPVRWLQGALRSRTLLAVDALRPLTVVVVLALALNLIVGLCSQELWPATIAAQLHKL